MENSNYIETELEKAATEGFWAYSKGVSHKDNPYPENDERREWWHEGWESGMYA